MNDFSYENAYRIISLETYREPTLGLTNVVGIWQLGWALVHAALR